MAILHVLESIAPRRSAGRAAPAVAALLVGLLLPSPPRQAAEYPQATISNGQVTASIYLPDANDGYYRSTRFDWSGAVFGLRYEGHDFYGPWFDRVDPEVVNWVYRDGEIVSGPCSALTGPVDEFETPLGWDQAGPGGTFIKLGVGVLRKTGDEYDRYVPYDIVDSGEWTVEKHADRVEFTQVLSDPESGYGYVYRKVVRLVEGKPEMVIERSLKNTGRLRIESEVYDHNFTVLDGQPPGPDFTIEVPYSIQTLRPPNEALVGVRGNRVVFAKQFSGRDQTAVLMEGFGDDPENSRIVIENSKVGAGMTISGDRPLIREFVWSIRTVLAIEAYVAIDIEPGAEFTWSNTYEYYAVVAGGEGDGPA